MSGEADSFDAICNRLIDAGLQNDAYRVTSIVGCRRGMSPSITQPLLRSPPIVAEILAKLGWNEGTEPIILEIIPPFYSISKALLLSASIYDTPWIIACLTVHYIQKSSLGRTAEVEQRSAIADIQSFLRKEVESWIDEDRREIAKNTTPYKRRSICPTRTESLSDYTPRHWVLEMVKTIMIPLHVKRKSTIKDLRLDGHSKSNSMQIMPLTLLSTIVTLVHSCDQDIVDEILDLIFQRPVKHCRVLLWFRIATELRVYLRDDNWDTVLRTTSSSLRKRPCQIPLRDYSGLIETILDLRRTAKFKITEDFDVELQEIILLLVSKAAASTDQSFFAEIENLIQSKLATMPTRCQEQWISSIEKAVTREVSMTTSKKICIQAILLLILSKTSRQSRSELVSGLVAEAFGGSAKKPSIRNVSMNVSWWNHILLIITADLPPSPTLPQCCRLSADSTSKDKVWEHMSRNLKEIFENMTYKGRGAFQVKGTKSGCRHWANVASCVGRKIHKIVFLGCKDLEIVAPYTIKRATELVTCCHESCAQDCKTNTLNFFVIMCTIFVTIFFEVPTVRSKMVEFMRQSLSGQRQTRPDSIVCIYLTAINFVVKNDATARFKTSSINKNSEIDKLSIVFSGNVEFNIYRELAWTLRSRASVRNALLIQAEKLMIRSQHCERSLSLETQNLMSPDGDDSTRQNLFSLLILVCDTDRSKDKDTAWGYLFCLIVQNRPETRISIRHWFFQIILAFVRERRFSETDALSVLRMCLARLFHFMKNDKQGHQTFSYNSAFQGKGNRIIQVEDICGLFSVSFEILQTFEDSCCCNLSKCRSILSGLLYQELKPAGSVLPKQCDDGMKSFSNLHFVNKESLAIVGIYLLHTAYCTESKRASVFEGKHFPPTKDILTQLISIEKASQSIAAYNSMTAKREDSTGGMSEPKLIDGKANFLRTGLCWILLDFLLKSDYFQSSASFFFLLCNLLNQIGQYQPDLQDDSDNLLLSCLDPKRIRRIVERASAYLNPITRSIHKTGSTLDDVVPFVSSISFMCKAYENSYSITPTDDDSECSQQRLGCILTLYASICSEKATICLLPLIEKGSRYAGKVDENTDGIVKNIRLSVSRYVSKNLALMANEVIDGSFLNFKKRPNLSSNDLLVLIETISSDIMAGIDGHSGGLTYGLYNSLLLCIEQSTILLLQVDFSLRDPYPELFNLEEVMKMASETILYILSTFPLKEAMAFKATLLLFLKHLPRTSRLALLGVLSRYDVSPTDSMPRSGLSTNLTRIFEQLFAVLGKRAEYMDQATVSWETIVGKEHLRNMDDFYVSDDASAMSDDSVFVHRRITNGKKLSGGLTSTRNDQKVVWFTEKAWMWSMSCLFETIDCFVKDTLNTMQNHELSIRFATSAFRYFDEGLNLLQEHLGKVCSFFQSIPSRDSSSLSLYAAALPVTSKLRLCSTIDLFLTLFEEATKLFGEYLRRVSLSRLLIQQNVQCVNVICCLAGWLATEFDFTTGIHAWNMSEKSAVSNDDTQSFESENSAIPRLAKLSLRSLELERRIEKVLFTLNDSGKYGSMAKEKISAFLSQSSSLPSRDFRTLFKKKQTFWKNQHELMGSEFCAITLDESNRMERKRKAEVRKTFSKEKRKKILRSRNCVIDRWLKMDREIDSKESRRVDTYADLEDFLVDA